MIEAKQQADYAKLFSDKQEQGKTPPRTNTWSYLESLNIFFQMQYLKCPKLCHR